MCRIVQPIFALVLGIGIALGVASCASPARELIEKPIVNEATTSSLSISEGIENFSPLSVVGMAGTRVGKINIERKKCKMTNGTPECGVALYSTCTGTIFRVAERSSRSDPANILTNEHCFSFEKPRDGSYWVAKPTTFEIGIYVDQGFKEAMDGRFQRKIVRVDLRSEVDAASRCKNDPETSNCDDYAIVRFAPKYFDLGTEDHLEGKQALSSVVPIVIRAAKPGERVFVLHYPGESDLTVTHAGTCRIGNSEDDVYPMVHHGCQTHKGSSGAVLIAETDGAFIGLHHSVDPEDRSTMSFRSTPMESIFMDSPFFNNGNTSPPLSMSFKEIPKTTVDRGNYADLMELAVNRFFAVFSHYERLPRDVGGVDGSRYNFKSKKFYYANDPIGRSIKLLREELSPCFVTDNPTVTVVANYWVNGPRAYFGMSYKAGAEEFAQSIANEYANRIQQDDYLKDKGINVIAKARQYLDPYSLTPFVSTYTTRNVLGKAPYTVYEPSDNDLDGANMVGQFTDGLRMDAIYDAPSEIVFEFEGASFRPEIMNDVLSSGDMVRAYRVLGQCFQE